MPPALSQAFAFQGAACVALGSPFMGQLCAILGSRDWPDTPLWDRYFTWKGDIGPSAQSLPLCLAGGLHALVLRGDPVAAVYPPHVVDDDILWAAVADAMVREDTFLNGWADSPPQTNEVRRAAVLIAVGQVLADRFGLPMRLSELGASGGLNLMWDQFAANLGGKRFGKSGADVILTPDWEGPAPPNCPLAWFGMEPDGQSPGAAMTLRIWPSDITIDLGRADFHGRWVQWKG